MGAKIRRWLCALLAACLLCSALPCAVMESDLLIPAPVDALPEEQLSEAVILDEEVSEEEDIDEEAPEEGEPEAEAPEETMPFAVVVNDGAGLYAEAGDAAPFAAIAAGSVTLLIDGEGVRPLIAYCGDEGIDEAYISESDIRTLSEDEREAYLDEAMAHDVVPYADDMDYPLLPAALTDLEEPEEAPDEEEAPDGEEDEEEIGEEFGLEAVEASDENARLPEVKSVEVKSNPINAGYKASFKVRTASSAKYLHLYSSAGKKLKTWKSGSYSTLSGGVRVWNVSYKIAKSGNLKYVFKASINGRKTGKGKSVRLTVIPKVSSAKPKTASVNVGAKMKITVKTDAGAKYLHAFDGNGNQFNVWGRKGHAKLSANKKTLIWTVRIKQDVGGKKKFVFKASLNKRQTGIGKTVKYSVIPKVFSATIAKESVNSGANQSFTVTTDAGAAYLHLCNKNGKTIRTWTRDGNARLSADGKKLTWKVSYKEAVSGSYKFIFKASLNKKKTGMGKTVKYRILSKVRKATAGKSTIYAGRTVKFKVKTDTGAQYLHLYNEEGRKLKTWKRAGNAKLSGDRKTLIWTVTRKYPRGDIYKQVFKSSADRSHTGIGKTVKITVLPKVASVKASETSVRKNKKVTLTVRTDAAAKFLTLYVSGEAYKTWRASSCSTLTSTGNYRDWTVKYTQSTTGKVKLTFKAALANRKEGIGKSIFIRFTEDPPKYRALLIGEESFTPRCRRNTGDVRLMKEMLSSITGPDGGRYRITTKKDLSKQQVLSAIRTTFAGATSRDVSLFFIATHGDTSFGTWYYPGYAGCLSMIPESSYVGDALLLSELADALKAVPGKVIVILESCGSGAAVYSTSDTENVSRLARLSAFDAAAVKAFSDADTGLVVDNEGNVFEAKDFDAQAKIGEFRVENKFYVLTASRFQESSYGREDGDASFNFFTIWLCAGIGSSGRMDADTNGNGITTLNELFKWIDRCGHQYGNDMQHVQVYPKNCSYGLFKR